MKVYIVWYINSSYQDTIQAIYLERKDAQSYINKQKDSVNYWIEEWELDG